VIRPCGASPHPRPQRPPRSLQTHTPATAPGFVNSKWCAARGCFRHPLLVGSLQVEIGGFEPPAPCTQNRCATRLRHISRTERWDSNPRKCRHQKPVAWTACLLSKITGPPDSGRTQGYRATSFPPASRCSPGQTAKAWHIAHRMSSVNVAGRSRTYLWRAFHTGGLFAGQLISRDLPQHARAFEVPGSTGLPDRFDLACPREGRHSRAPLPPPAP
jgi:hypothetical protein